MIVVRWQSQISQRLTLGQPVGKRDPGSPLSFPARPLGGGYALEPPCFGLCLAGGFVAATCCGGSYQHDEASPLVFLGHRVPVGPGGLGSKLESCV